MSPDEFGRRVTALGMSLSQFATLTGANERTVRRWRAGEVTTPGWVPLVLDLLEAVDDPQRFIQQRL